MTLGRWNLKQEYSDLAKMQSILNFQGLNKAGYDTIYCKLDWFSVEQK